MTKKITPGQKRGLLRAIELGGVIDVYDYKMRLGRGSNWGSTFDSLIVKGLLDPIVTRGKVHISGRITDAGRLALGIVAAPTSPVISTPVSMSLCNLSEVFGVPSPMVSNAALTPMERQLLIDIGQEPLHAIFPGYFMASAHESFLALLERRFVVLQGFFYVVTDAGDKALKATE